MSAASNPSVPALLALRDVHVRYEGVIVALSGVTLDVPAGAIVALLGANGAGKTTTLKAASRLLGAERGEVVAGSIRFDGEAIDRLPPHRLVERGVAQVLEGRRCFAHLSVEQNLVLGSFVRRPRRGELAAALERIYARFPRLKERRRSQAGYLSGGEQQMVAIGRALMAQPRLVLLDEPSMGLAPRVVQEIYEGVGELNRRDGLSVLLAEQNALIALQHAHHAYVLEDGRVALHGPAEALSQRDDIQHFYLGGHDSQRRPFIDAHRVRDFRPAAGAALFPPRSPQ
ncbi:ABC transporter ATP-binding protein [Aquabacterium sp. A7-Y]|uniref:ABC transporter ATP-binding protein n=1 Tax=Aquabacterium sp. A7-Y TaxID=1349605 RepID=UPI00223CBE6F|nr:ABC transporter ATP-binding protein [Aquabacterium sp. A7-Y]MCW7540164.1 ABC transporter ATP-binding protein [Aquabacterium sp. A7-Y]